MLNVNLVNDMTIGNRVHAILKERGIMQKTLAEHIGSPPATVTGWKEPNRNPSSDLIIPICDFLGISPYFLLTGQEQDGERHMALDPNEQSLLSAYRAMTKDQQQRILGYADGIMSQTEMVPTYVRKENDNA